MPRGVGQRLGFTLHALAIATDQEYSQLPPSRAPVLRPVRSLTASSQPSFAMTSTASVGTYDYVWHWYDGHGRRVVTHAQQGSSWTPGTAPSFSAGTRFYYVYDGADVALVVAHAGSQWWLHQRALSGGVDRPLAGWFYTNGGMSAGNLALVADVQGSIRAAVKPDGSRDDLAPYFQRNAWGAFEGASGTGGGSNQTNTQTGYTGASSPTVTGGFTYLRNRWYDAATGRFLTQDLSFVAPFTSGMEGLGAMPSGAFAM